MSAPREESPDGVPAGAGGLQGTVTDPEATTGNASVRQWPARLLIAQPDGSMQPATIDQKGMLALFRWRHHDCILADVGEMHMRLSNAGHLSEAEQAEVSEGLVEQLQILAWIALSLGRDLPAPIAEATTWDLPAGLPEDIRAMTPIVLAGIRQTFVEAHSEDFAAMELLFSPESPLRLSREHKAAVASSPMTMEQLRAFLGALRSGKPRESHRLQGGT